MALPTRHLGRNGPPVTAIGLGLMSLGGIYGQKDSIDEKLKFLDRAHELGEHFWDTADAYLDSEDRIGDWFKKTGKRSDIFIASKFGMVYEESGPAVRTDPEHVRAACDRSLKRMGIETIDLYYAHRVDDKTPIEKTIEAMVELKKEGKIRYLGLSECSANTIRRAHAVHPITAYQVEYNLFCLDIESSQLGILNTCHELGIAIIAYSPMGRGMLTGEIKSFDDFPENDFRRSLPNYQKENFPNILSLVDKVKTVAQQHNASPGQVCIAWVEAQSNIIIAIPGTRRIKYLEENVKAGDLKLTDDELKELRRYAEETKLPGDRYSESMMKMIFRESVAL